VRDQWSFRKREVAEVGQWWSFQERELEDEVGGRNWGPLLLPLLRGEEKEEEVEMELRVPTFKIGKNDRKREVHKKRRIVYDWIKDEKSIK
jgi:hypothetical protein